MNETMPPVQLKVGGIDLKCFGNINGDDDVSSYTGGDVEQHQWKHLMVKNGHLRGGVFINSPLVANAAIAAAKHTDKKLSEAEIKKLMSTGNS
jgi:NAD(P)H-nitrite reductase large subunit